jgi:2-polyprenyl-3-methyl-5-hydroxy-6-metoxy-1,4-benzoquinol methylase
VSRVPETRRASRYRRITATRPHKTALVPRPEGAPAGASRYEREIDLASDSTHACVIRLVGSGKHVLELGCSTGYMTRVLRDQGCRVVAVEMDAEAAHRAKPFCERIVVGDIERLDLAHVLGQRRFDVVVAADFLEHLKDPLALLCSLKPFLRDGGYVVSSLPNVAHGSVRLALLGGRFPSTETGLLDRDHLHFYTHQSMEALFEAAGFAIGRLERQTLPLDASEVPYDASVVPVDVLQALSADEDALTYQYVTVAYPIPGALLEVFRDRLRRVAAEAAGLQTSKQELAAEADALRARAAELQNQNQGLTSVNEELSAELGALRQALAARESETAVVSADLAATRTDAVHLRSLLLDAHDQLLRRDDQIAELQARAGEQGDLEPQLRERQASVASLREELALTKARMLGMQATRVWRIGKCYWWLEARLKGMFGIE